MQEVDSRTAGVVIDAIGNDGTSPVRSDAFPSRRISSLNDQVVFARVFLTHPRQIGSVVPSSSFLEQRIVRTANLAHARTVVELGPGTGGTTRALLRTMRPDAHLLAIELSPEFHVRIGTRLADPRLLVQLGSAEQLPEFLEAWRLPAPDVIVSGIPFSTMSGCVGDGIAAVVAGCLAPGGRFVAYQVRSHVARFTAPYLGKPVISTEWLNVPPMRVFRWVKPLKAS